MSGIVINSPRPVKYGGFVDVFSGNLNGQPIAIKRPRINDDEHGKTFRVSFMADSQFNIDLKSAHIRNSARRALSGGN
jgi:hypothetical protein